MKKILITIGSLLPLVTYGQVANDNCNTATAVVIPASGNACVTGTTAGAISDNTTNACDTGTPGVEVWYTFTATGSQNTITVTPTGGGSAIQQAVLTIDGTGCADAAYNICNASATNGGTATAAWTFTPGTQVWISIESNNNVQGQFQLCITSVTPPAGAGSSCATATTICNTNSFSVATFPNNNNGFTPNCFFSSLQQPIFYQFTVGQSGTCIWNADPTGAAEYDWAMYNITAGCPGTLVCCNYNYASATGAPVGMATGGAGACGTSGFAGAPGELSPPANVTAGQTYLIIIDNYSNNSVGFNFTWGGTFQIAPVAQFTANPLTACGSANVNITNTSVASTSYSWNFGNGNTSTATNPPSQSYTSPGTYLISLVATSATGCQDVASQAITINTAPTVNVPANITTCPGSNVAATAFTSNPGGATYTWTNSNTAIGLAASGSGNVPAFTATNATGAAITATITVTPTLGGCVGTPSSYTITVNPLPVASVPANASYCPGATVPASAYTSTPAGATYTWTNSNTSIGLGASGTGNTPSFTATNATGAAITGTITVTPTLNGCTGNTSTYTITVNPNPTVTVPANITTCPGSNVAASAFTSTPAGATFAWTNSNTSIGLAASGTGNQPAFTATNGTGAAISGTITVTPTLNGCTGTPNTYTITVNPTPTANVPANATYCPGNAVPAGNFTSNPAG
ncbi:MAG: PKD domain-containing protein, partial [Bacteroidota bacterium]